MRTFKTLFTLFIVLCFSMSAEDKKKIYFLYGKPSHGPGYHEFRAGSILLAKALNEQSGLNVEAVVHDGWPKDDTILDDASTIIIFSDATKVVRNGWKKMDELMKKGVGCMFMHYAVHPTIENGEKYFIPWMGGYFKNGVSVNPHWVASMEGLKDHPVSNGIKFPVKALDEWYYNMGFPKGVAKWHSLVEANPNAKNMIRINNLWNQPGIDALNKPNTLMWGLEREDGGRGVGFTGGHYHRNWAIDGFRTVVLNAICWTAKIEIPKDGVKSEKVTAEQLNLNLDGKPKKPLTVPTDAEFDALKRTKILPPKKRRR